MNQDAWGVMREGKWDIKKGERVFQPYLNGLITSCLVRCWNVAPAQCHPVSPGVNALPRSLSQLLIDDALLFVSKDPECVGHVCMTAAENLLSIVVKILNSCLFFFCKILDSKSASFNFSSASSSTVLIIWVFLLLVPPSCSGWHTLVENLAEIFQHSDKCCLDNTWLLPRKTRSAAENCDSAVSSTVSS